MARCPSPNSHHAKPTTGSSPIIPKAGPQVKKRGHNDEKYNLSEIMHKAWKLYRKGVGSFAETYRAWNSAKSPVNAQRIEEAQQMGWPSR